ncbi:hypothetical protein COJ96_02500 [Bacillus sp. AFS073361]|uniref:polysaccharide pyruvyl transferase family protein n=1 Tax=Bacillus sp. AFS073361 TaxID=2033511 RepID=UPI000BF67B63|nr:polysaccharide pyruvyl transferase family protein [Bacillus sp. AFS073361]PFP30854.1 hypothetical protein COJ96_02500 [Bacillus sp. AFS073361]
MSKICIVGAFDRYNYGDILFPIVIEKYIKDNLKDELKDSPIEFYALKDTDLTNIKGVKTKNIKHLKNDVKDGNNIIIIAGGDVLPVRIFHAFSDLIENKIINKLMNQTIRVFGTSIYDKFLINYYDLSSKFPWIIKNDDSNIKNYVFYNAVGASSIYKLPHNDLEVMKGLLEKSDYISVRDLKSKENLNNIGIKPLVYPDSAIIMSELFSDEFLLENTTQEVKNYISESSGFICLQLNMYSLKGNEERVVSEIEQLIKETKLKLVLLPIGKANNHNDLDALRIIKSKLNLDAYLPENLNIYDVMYLIAKSNLFIGTSLHGNITAISFGVPHIGLNKDIEKLDYFLKCWDIEEIDGCINIDEINKSAQKILRIDRKKLLKKRDDLIRLSNENFQKMFSIKR